MDDPILRQVISTRPLASGRGVTKRINLDTSEFKPRDINCPPRRKPPRPLPSMQPDRDGTISVDNDNTQALPSIYKPLSGLHNFSPPPAHTMSHWDVELEGISNQATVGCRIQQRPPIERELHETDTLELLVLEWTNLTQEEIVTCNNRVSMSGGHIWTWDILLLRREFSTARSSNSLWLTNLGSKRWNTTCGIEGAQVWVRYYLHLLIASHATAGYITNYDVTKRNYRITKSIVETKSIITYEMFTLQSERDRK